MERAVHGERDDHDAMMSLDPPAPDRPTEWPDTMDPAERARRRALIEALRAFRAEHPLGDVTIRELIDDGRR